MSQQVEISYLLTVETERMQTELRQIESIAFRTLHILRRLGLPPEADALIAKCQQIIHMITMLRANIHLLEAASGPVGWTLFAVSAIGTAVTVGNSLYDGSRGY